MRVLVGGANGLIGRALCADLRRNGHEVATLVRAGLDSGRGGVEVPWDPESGTLDSPALIRAGPIDAVVNLAGAGLGDRRWTLERRRAIVDSRVTATRGLVDALAALDPLPSVLVNASAVGFYGDRGDEVLEEDSAPGTGFLADLCRAWEDAAAAAGDRMRVVRLRTGIVLSPTGGALARQLPLFRLGLGGRLGDGRQWTSWISLDDEVAVIRRALEDPVLEGPLNATAPQPVTNAEFTAALGRALHRPARLTVPRLALSLALGSEMVREMVLAGQRVVPARLLSAGHRFADPDIAAALARVLAPHA